MRILFITLLRIRNSYQRKQLDCSCFPLLCCHIHFMCFQHFFNLFPDSHGWVQRSHRILKYHSNLRSTDRLHFSFCVFSQVFAIIHDSSLSNFSVFRKNPHNSFHGNRFSGTGLSYYCQCFLFIQIEVYIADCLHGSFMCFDMYCQITDF